MHGVPLLRPARRPNRPGLHPASCKPCLLPARLPQLVEEGLQEQGQPLGKEDQQFMAECRRRQDEAVRAGLCSSSFAI